MLCYTATSYSDCVIPQLLTDTFRLQPFFKPTQNAVLWLNRKIAIARKQNFWKTGNPASLRMLMKGFIAIFSVMVTMNLLGLNTSAVKKFECIEVPAHPASELFIYED